MQRGALPWIRGDQEYHSSPHRLQCTRLPGGPTGEGEYFGEEGGAFGFQLLEVQGFEEELSFFGEEFAGQEGQGLGLLGMEGEEGGVEGMHFPFGLQVEGGVGAGLQQLQQFAFIGVGIEEGLGEDGLAAGVALLAFFAVGMQQGGGEAQCWAGGALCRVGDAQCRQVAQPVALAALFQFEQQRVGAAGVEAVYGGEQEAPVGERIGRGWGRGSGGEGCTQQARASKHKAHGPEKFGQPKRVPDGCGLWALRYEKKREGEGEKCGLALKRCHRRRPTPPGRGRWPGPGGRW